MMHLKGDIRRVSRNGFIAVASTPTVDSDHERILPGAFNPLPSGTIPVHMNHDIRADNIVARARPYYEGSRLMIDATFGTTESAKAARDMVKDGLIDSVSIVFTDAHRRTAKDGVVEITKGKLRACDLVSIGANPDARILSVRSLRQAMSYATADARANALLALAEAEVATAKALLRSTPTRAIRSAVDAEIRNVLRSI